MNYDTRSHNNLQPLAASVALLVLIVLKVWGLAKTHDLMPADDPFYLPRQITFLLVWVSLLYFFFQLHLFCKYENMLSSNIKEQKWAALIASIACMVKAIWTFIHTIITSDGLDNFTFYYIVEVIVWLILARYLFGSYNALRNLYQDLKQEESEY